MEKLNNDFLLLSYKQMVNKEIFGISKDIKIKKYRIIRKLFKLCMYYIQFFDDFLSYKIKN